MDDMNQDKTKETISENDFESSCACDEEGCVCGETDQVEEVAKNSMQESEVPEIKSTETLLNEATTEISNLKDQILRQRAEFENFRKRKETEKQEFMKYAHEKIVIEMISVLDSFHHALELIDDQHNAKQILEGMELIHKQFIDVLSKAGVSVIESVGKPFDPNSHQAISQEQLDGTEPGLVTKEFQRGYKLGLRVIRPAMVIVSQ